MFCFPCKFLPCSRLSCNRHPFVVFLRSIFSVLPSELRSSLSSSTNLIWFPRSFLQSVFTHSSYPPSSGCLPLLSSLGVYHFSLLPQILHNLSSHFTLHILWPSCVLPPVTFPSASVSASVSNPYVLVHRAQWLRGRASDSRLRGPGFESCAAVLKPSASFFILHCSSSLSCIYE